LFHHQHPATSYAPGGWHPAPVLPEYAAPKPYAPADQSVFALPSPTSRHGQANPHSGHPAFEDGRSAAQSAKPPPPPPVTSLHRMRRANRDNATTHPRPD